MIVLGRRRCCRRRRHSLVLIMVVASANGARVRVVWLVIKLGRIVVVGVVRVSGLVAGRTGRWRLNLNRATSRLRLWLLYGPHRGLI